jgi:predicted transcriptional regulator
VKPRDLNEVEQKVLRGVCVGNVGLDLFLGTTRRAVDVAIKTLVERGLIRMGSRRYYIPTQKGRRCRWAKLTRAPARPFVSE